MRLWRCHLRTWGRRNFLMMSFWYFAIIFSAFLYYTYAKWRPVHLYSALFDKPIAGARPGDVLLMNGDVLRWQREELKRILDENPSLAARHAAHNIGPGGDTTVTMASAVHSNNQQLPISNAGSRNIKPKKSIQTSYISTKRTCNESVAGSGSHHRITNSRRAVTGDAENEVEIEEVEVEEEGRYPGTDTVVTAVGFENATLKPPLPSVVDGYERVESEEGLRLHCGRCAVVSSSGHLINKSRGREIDSAQCVVRMNSAPTVGYEDDVGARTTVRVIGHVNMLVLNSSSEFQQEIFINQTSRADKIIIPWLHTVNFQKETNIHYKIAKDFSKTFPDVEFYFLSPEKSKLAEDLFKSETGLTTKEANTWLSTGWMTLLFAIDVCDEIDIYGLVDDSYCRNHPNDSTPYHYYDPGGIIECVYYRKSEERLTGGHLFITEKAVFARWAHKFNFSFHDPEWNTTSLNANLSLALETPFLKKFYEASRNKRTVGHQRKVVRRVVRRIVVRRKVPVVKIPNL